MEEAILEAAWEELRAVGYDHVTMDGIAARAATSKAVLYRRWPERTSLLVAAFRRVVTPVAESLPDTGSLRGDLIAVLQMTRDHLLVLQAASPGAVYGFFRDLEARNAERDRLSTAVIRPLLARAAERGELDLEDVPERVLRLPLDLHRHEVLVTGRPPGDDAIEEIVDVITLPVLRSLAR